MKNDKVHETCCISDDAVIGEGTRMWQFCIVMQGAVIGKNCNIGQNVFVESGVKVGDGVTIKNSVSLYEGFVCEDDVFLGPNCVFTNVLTPRSFVSRKNEFMKTIIRKGASIGANATIVCGHEIGKYAMVGAGAVVTRDVPDYALVVGNPAKRIGYVCRCGERIFEDDNYCCGGCGAKYAIQGGRFVEIQ